MLEVQEVVSRTDWPPFLAQAESQILAHLRDYAKLRRNDIERGAESPAMAALLVEKYAEGMARSLGILGFPSKVQQLGDQLVRELDPAYDANRKARWEARPAALTYEQPQT
jgi:hypothetical protein